MNYGSDLTAEFHDYLNDASVEEDHFPHDEIHSVSDETRSFVVFEHFEYRPSLRSHLDPGNVEDPCD
jgi:hypothetical protein